MEKQLYTSMTVSVTLLKIVGFWSPRESNFFEKNILRLYTICMFMFLLGIWNNNEFTLKDKILHICYGVFIFMFVLGTYLIIQIVDLYMIWGNLPAMTGTAFLLFTNLAHTTKVVNVIWRKKEIQRIIDEGNHVLGSVHDDQSKAIVIKSNRDMIRLQMFYFLLTTVTIGGWAGSAEKNQLPMRAWYPYDTSKSPAYEATYCHQVVALFISAYLNVAKDTLVVALMAQCRCRLQLINNTLRSLHNEIHDNILEDEKTSLLTASQESIAARRLETCVIEHQATLQAVKDVERCFSAPTFAQFTVSLVIICVTAFQLASQTGNPVRLASMTTYLLNMSYQVFIYCYQGEMLKEESTEIGGAAYHCLWYRCSTSFRRTLLNVAVRSRRPAQISAGGFTTLSLQSFMAIIKASYSFFTVLKQVDAGA